MANAWRGIPPLLHDARLSDCLWDRHLKTLHLHFQCLRRNVDGTPLEDKAVELRHCGVEQILAYYSPAGVGMKPSEFKLESRLAKADLEAWPYGPAEANLTINSPHSEFDLATSCVQETLFSEQANQGNESKLRVHVYLDPCNTRAKAASSSLCICCDSLEPFTSGIPLDLETWRSQFEAWWKGWRGHWSKKTKDDSGNADSSLEDTFIPAGQDEQPDFSYRPPQVAPFLLSATDAPAELLKPIEDYHTGFYDRDWLKMAAACPDFDHEPDQRATDLRKQYLGYKFGRWVYVRRIDGWWCEGNRACVVVRGIEHQAAFEEFPTSNEETVITYDLRKFRQTWVIYTWSQGWPRHGSAERLNEPQQWRDGWNLAE